MTGGGKFGFAGYAAASSGAAPPPPVTPPGPLTIYGDISSPGVGDPATISGCAMDSSQFPNFGISIGVNDQATGSGLLGMGFNKSFDSSWAIPPGANATFVIFGSNTPASKRTTIVVDAADYATNWFSFGPPGSYEDVLNYAGFCENLGGTATFSWDAVITTQSLSNGCVAAVSGTSSTAQDSTFGSIGGFGIGRYIVINAGRGGYPAAGDSMVIDVTVTATNTGGSALDTFRCNIDWV
jgi:hypothetical protein